MTTLKPSTKPSPFLGCRRINGKVYVWDSGIKFLVTKAEVV